MALASYNDLKTATQDWLARNGDNALAARADDFILLCEARIRNGTKNPDGSWRSKPLRIRAMEVRATSDADEQYIDLPLGFLQMRRLRLLTDPVTVLKLVSAEYLEIIDNVSPGLPRMYAVVDDQLQFDRPPDTTYVAEMVYWKAFDALSADNPTNWLLTNSPDIYLFGTLAEAAAYLQNGPAFQSYDTRFTTSMDALQGSNDIGTISGALPAARVVGMQTP